MFFKLKRFLSVSLCFIFYIFLFAGNFGGNSCNAAHGLDGSIKKFIPINISSNFNSNEIWGIDEDWSKITKRWGHYYTKAPGRNNNADGLPTDGKITISNIPFNLKVKSDSVSNSNSDNDDCINVSNDKVVEINFSTPIKVKNLYILGTLNGLDPSAYENPDNFDVKFYDENDTIIEKYTQILDAYDWCYSRYELNQIIKAGTSSLVGYKDYNVRNEDSGGQAVYYGSNPAMQCWRLNKFTDNTSFDKEIKKIKFNKNGSSTSNLMIFGVTAEVEYDNNITLSDIKHDSFKIACETSGDKQVKISTTEGLNSESMETKMFPYTHKADEGTTYYCTIYDKTKKAYYYFDVTAKKSLKIVVRAPSNLVYNGAAQRLVTEVQTLDVNGAARPVDKNTLLKANIYLRVMNAEGTPIHDTGWYNLNSLANLTATNAGTYIVYYYVDEDALSDYELVAPYATIVNIN